MRTLVTILFLTTSLYANTIIDSFYQTGTQTTNLYSTSNDSAILFVKQGDPTYTYWTASNINHKASVKVYNSNGILQCTVDSTKLSSLKKTDAISIIHTQFKVNLPPPQDTLYVNYIITKDVNDTLHVSLAGGNGDPTAPWAEVYKFYNLSINSIKANRDSLYYLSNDSLYSFTFNNISKRLITTNVFGFYFDNLNRLWISTNANEFAIFNGTKSIINTYGVKSNNFFVTPDSTIYYMTNSSSPQLFKLKNDINDLVLLNYHNGSQWTTPWIKIVDVIEKNTTNTWLKIAINHTYLTVWDTIFVQFDNNSSFYNFNVNAHLPIIMDGNSTAYQGFNQIDKHQFNHYPIVATKTNEEIQWININNKQISYTYNFQITDFDNNTFTYKKLSGPAWNNPTKNPDTITVANVDTGLYNFTMEITDNGIPNLKDTVSWTLKVYTNIIEAVSTPQTTMDVLTTYSSDINILNTTKGYLIYSTKPNWMTITRTSNTTYHIGGIPTKTDTGTFAIKYIFTDSTNYSHNGIDRGFTYDTVSYNLKVDYKNRAPKLPIIHSGFYLGSRGFFYHDSTITVTLNATDDDLDPLTYSFENNDTIQVANTTNAYYVTPNTHRYGQCFLTVKVSDKDTTVSGKYLFYFLYTKDTLTTTSSDTTYKSDTLHITNVDSSKETVNNLIITTHTNINNTTINDSTFITNKTIHTYREDYTPYAYDTTYTYNKFGTQTIHLDTNITKDTINIEIDTIYTSHIDTLGHTNKIDTNITYKTIKDTINTDTLTKWIDTLITTKTITTKDSIFRVKLSIATYLNISDTTKAYDTLATILVKTVIDTNKTVITNNFPKVLNTTNTFEIKTTDTLKVILNTIDKDNDSLVYTFIKDTIHYTITNINNTYKIVPKTDGQNTITLTVTDGKKEITYNITVNAQIPTSTLNKTNNYRTYFNANKNSIKYGLAKTEMVTIMVFNLKGQMINTIQKVQNAGEYTMHMNLIAGQYIYKVQIGNLKTIQKIAIM